MNQSDARLLHELGERSRVLLHSYFRSPSALLVSFTHLVCRSAIAGNAKMIHISLGREILITYRVSQSSDFSSVTLNVFFWDVKLFVGFFSLLLGDQEGRLDLSHPVHVDNCLLEPETKQCWREPPAFIHRDLRYTKIIKEGKSRENTNGRNEKLY